MEKIKELVKSISFWYTVALAVAYLLDSTDVVPSAYANAVEIFTALGISIKRIDGFRS